MAQPIARPSRENRMVVVAWGCVTPLGQNAIQSAFGFRAGASGLGQCAVLDPTGEVPVMATVPTLNPYAEGAVRLQPLLLLSIDEALAPILPVINGLAATVYFLADEDASPAIDATTTAESLGLVCRDRVREATNTRARVEVRRTGAAGLGEVLEQAQAELNSGTVQLVVICAAHTDYDRASIQWLSEHRRLHTPDSLDGMILAEMAGTIVLCTATVARQLRLVPALCIQSFAYFTEKATWFNDESAYEALALTLAARHATEPYVRANKKIGWMSSDASLESLRIAELQALITRLQSRLGPPQQLDTPGHRIGHLGAAMGLWQTIYAAEAYMRGFACSPELLCLLGSEQGRRAALMLSHPDSSPD
jgi:hypothetical protein